MSAGGRVYSTEHGRMCPDCDRPVADCVCGPEGQPPVAGPIRVHRETQGRRGKAVTVIRGLPLTDPSALRALAKTLKRRCGAGGTVRQGVIEIQGEHRDAVVAALAALGYAAQRVSG